MTASTEQSLSVWNAPASPFLFGLVFSRSEGCAVEEVEDLEKLSPEWTPRGRHDSNRM